MFHTLRRFAEGPVDWWSVNGVDLERKTWYKLTGHSFRINPRETTTLRREAFVYGGGGGGGGGWRRATHDDDDRAARLADGFY